MSKKRTGLLGMMLAGVFLLSGCGQVDESILDTPADLSVSINVPYATATPLPEYLDMDDPVVIDPNGGVTVNDPSLLPVSAGLATEDTGQYTTLSLGDTGFAVQALQKRLQDLGYFLNGVSGIFDADTEKAVKRFEQSYGIMQTGIATPAFQARLFSSDAPVYRSQEYQAAVVSQYSTLQSGAVGSSVYALQHRLKELGYPISNLTGVYDENTQEAVRLFYIAYGLEPQSVAYISLQQYLYSEDARPYTVDGEVQVSEEDDTTLVPGNVGTLVMQIQNRLIQLGYMTTAASGIYDTETEAAVRLFQEACGVKETGTLTYSLQAILLSDQAPPYGTYYSAEEATYVDLSQGAQGREVLALQNRLIELGYATGAGNGVYGVETATALRMFQRYNNLEETGVASAYVQSCLYSPTAITYADVLSGITSHATPVPANPAAAAPQQQDDSDEIHRTLVLNSSGQDVTRLQTRLVELLYPCEINGLYDEATVSAVRSFQSAIGLPQSGEASVYFQRYLYSDGAPNANYRLYHSTQDFTILQEGDTGDAVTRLQQRLWALGYLLTESVENSIGTYHNATKLAVASAQLAMGYDEADGVASAEFQCFLMSEYGEWIKK